MNIAIITGASSGMGKEFVKQLDTMCNLDEFWIIARRKERLEELSKIIQHKVRIFALDITDSTDIAKLKYALKKEQPIIRILVNSAGFGLVGRFTDISLESQLNMIELNCNAVVNMCYMCLPYMKRNSRIINMASAASFAPQPNFTIYAASKAFVHSFNQALNRELHNRHVYVTSVCPGPVDTEFFNICTQTGDANWIKTLVKANPQKVVYKALKDSINKKPVSIYGPLMSSWNLISGIVPTNLVMRFY